MVVQLSGFADDPIAKVRTTIGLTTDLGGGMIQRIITMQVVDRLDAPYPPASFKQTNGTDEGRWWVCWYGAPTKFGTVTDFGATYSTGRRMFAPISGIDVAETDENGALVFQVVKAAGDTWFHGFVLGLPRARGFSWANGQSVDIIPGSGGGGIYGPGSIPDMPGGF